jgi:hypothetical protein
VRVDGLAVVFFLVDVVVIDCFFDAGFIDTGFTALASLRLDLGTVLLAVFAAVVRDVAATFFLAAAADAFTARTCLIALECSWSVILNSWWPSELATK